MTPPKFALHSQSVITPLGVRPAAVLVDNGHIVDVVTRRDVPNDFPIEDVGDLVISPGLIDAHVHINEPGRTEWEGFATATRAAAAGGITTLIDMPLNSDPATTTAAALAQKRAAAQGQCWVDVGFYGGLVPGNVVELPGLLDEGVFGIKAFLTHSGIDDFPNATEADLRAAMPLLAPRNVPLLAHAEIGSGPDVSTSDPTVYDTWLRSRPPSMELDAIRLLVRLCRQTGCPTHIVHLATAAALPDLVAARSQRLPLTVETAPHYLYFAAEEVPDGDTRFKCAPPIREADNRKPLWTALRDGVIDFVATDHSPCPPPMKNLDEGDFMSAWGGIASLQMLLPVVWTAATADFSGRGHLPADLARWLSRWPAQFLGLLGRKGAIEPGYEADLVVWNPEATFAVEPETLQHRHKITPYAGETLRGVVQRTYLRGEMVYNEGDFSPLPTGALLHRPATP